MKIRQMNRCNRQQLPNKAEGPKSTIGSHGRLNQDMGWARTLARISATILGNTSADKKASTFAIKPRPSVPSLRPVRGLRRTCTRPILMKQRIPYRIFAVVKEYMTNTEKKVKYTVWGSEYPPVSDGRGDCGDERCMSIAIAFSAMFYSRVSGERVEKVGV